MIRDENKRITNIKCNYLNLPEVIEFTFGSSAYQSYIKFVYDASGVKLRKIVQSYNNATLTSEKIFDYVNGVEYEGTNLTRLSHTEGAVVKNAGGGYEYEYVLRDHLGNTRATFRDSNNDGVVTPSDICQINNYYPFGLNMEGNWSPSGCGAGNKFQYNGKELNSDFGLEWNDYGARFYDAAIGRFPTVDPLSEKMRRHSPYNYAFDNPIRFIDPDGMQATDVYVDREGNYLGKDDAETNDVRVTTKEDWGNAKKDDQGVASSSSAQKNSEKLTEYAEGIKITTETKEKIAADGGNMPEPFVTNNSNATIFYKPEGPPHDGQNGTVSGPDPNPCTPVTGAFPIAPHTDLYVPVDGIKTTKTPEGKVFKMPTGGTVYVNKNGSPDMSFYGVGDLLQNTVHGNVKPPDAGWNNLKDSKPHK